MKSISIDNLPKYIDGRLKGKINWKQSIGYILNFIYEDIIGVIKIVEYCYDNKNRPYLKVEYNNETFNITGSHLSECKIGNIIGTKSKKYSYKIDDIVYVNTGKILILEQTRIKEGKHTTKAYKYKCLECNYIGIISEKHLKEYCGCSACCPSPRKVVKGINDIATTHPHLVRYFKKIEDTYKYTYANNTKILMKCPDCGREKMISPNTFVNNGLGCICSDSIPYGEKFTFGVLEQLGLDFIVQLSKTNFKWCEDYRYDFYFNHDKKTYLCEANGFQHYRDAWDKLEKTQLNDKNKKELALANGIKEENYIVIDCRKSELEWIKQSILDSRLNKLFDLSKIDWNKCHEFACSNLVKIACEYWNNGINNTTEIANIMHLHRTTICRYLKQGKDLQWTTYDEQLSRTISEGKLGKNAKEVKCIENGLIFESCSDLERQSEKIFGVYLNQNNISSVCRHVRKSYKGYTFVYTN